MRAFVPHSNEHNFRKVELSISNS